MMKLNVAIRAAVAAALMMLASAAFAQQSALRPPAGHRMAILVWEDLECPACSRADATLVQAQHNYNIPLVRHDYVIASHPWSRDAHIMARYFDTLSPALGEQFRQYIFRNQTQIYRGSLRNYAERFAAAHHATFPSFYDPSGKLQAKVDADIQLGNSLGIHQTPTIYIVTDSPRQIPPREIDDFTKLFQTLDEIKAKLPPAAHSTAKHGSRK